MPLKKVWIGGRLFTYDTDNRYPDGVSHRAIYGAAAEILEALSELVDGPGELLVGTVGGELTVLEPGELGQVLAVDPDRLVGLAWVDLVGGVPQLSDPVWLQGGSFFVLEDETDLDVETLWLQGGSFPFDDVAFQLPQEEIFLHPSQTITETL